MRRLIFEQDHDVFRQAARQFVQREIGPHAEHWRRQGFVDRDAFRKAGEQGYLLMWADARHGGAGLADFRYEQILCEENVRFGEIGFYHALHSRVVGPYLGKLGTVGQKDRFLPRCVRGELILALAMTEPEAGSDLSAMRTRAQDHGDHWLLNGSKTYISNGIQGDLFVVAARTSPAGSNGIGLFLVERGMAGFSRGRKLEKMGLQAQDTAELFLEDVRVPKDNVLGDPSQGLTYLKAFLVEERLVASVQSIAHAQVGFDVTLDYITERRAFGRAIGTFQHSRFVMAELRAQLDAIQTFVDQGVLEHNAGRLVPETAAALKLLSSEIENRVADVGVQLHGGAGYMQECRISRMYTDARVSRIFAGSSEIMKEIIGRALGLDDRTTP